MPFDFFRGDYLCNLRHNRNLNSDVKRSTQFQRAFAGLFPPNYLTERGMLRKAGEAGPVTFHGSQMESHGQGMARLFTHLPSLKKIQEFRCGKARKELPNTLRFNDLLGWACRFPLLDHLHDLAGRLREPESAFALRR
jgi:hypothetical protein